MAPDSNQHRNGFQIDRIRWEWPNPKGDGLQKLIPYEHIVGVFSVLENGVKSGQRALEGIRSTNFCKFQLPNASRGTGRQAEEAREPVRAPVLSTSASTIQSATPASVAHEAESNVKATEPRDPRFTFRVPEVTSGGAVTKEELGRATWTFLHTLAAQFPDQPTRQQQRDVKELMSIMTRLYPCKTCAEHFKDVLKAYPVKAGSGVELAQWMCQVHNVVNRSLDKPQFPCQRVDARWGELHCDEGACDLEGRVPYR